MGNEQEGNKLDRSGIQLKQYIEDRMDSASSPEIHNHRNMSSLIKPIGHKTESLSGQDQDVLIEGKLLQKLIFSIQFLNFP